MKDTIERANKGYVDHVVFDDSGKDFKIISISNGHIAIKSGSKLKNYRFKKGYPDKLLEAIARAYINHKKYKSDNIPDYLKEMTKYKFFDSGKGFKITSIQSGKIRIKFFNKAKFYVYAKDKPDSLVNVINNTYRLFLRQAKKNGFKIVKNEVYDNGKLVARNIVNLLERH